MSIEDIPRNPIPWWFWVITIICALPLLAYPWLLSDAPAGSPARTFVVLYPAYVIGSAICALICYGRRPEISWILLALMLLTHAAIWFLVTAGVGD